MTEQNINTVNRLSGHDADKATVLDNQSSFFNILWALLSLIGYWVLKTNKRSKKCQIMFHGILSSLMLKSYFIRINMSIVHNNQ